jgi:hypothetical protein
MIFKHLPLSRRTVLRGLGTAMALPWLEAMTPLSRLRGALIAAEPTRPLRTAFLFFPNGTHFADWAPRGEGRNIEIPSLLEPLARHRENILFLRGLSHRNARALGDGPGDHARSAACFLTGAHPFKTPGADIHCGVSVDQAIAAQIGSETPLSSLQLGCEGGRRSGQCDSGYACAYSNNISWADPHTPLSNEIHPRQLLDRLFLRGPAAESTRAREERLVTRRSILDFVREDARRLEKNLGVRDRRKLDAYLTGVREIERRIEQAERLSELEQRGEGIEVPDRIPRDYSEHVKLQMELMILAFRLDLTRVATFMIANEGSNRSFPNLGVRGGHHQLSHHKGEPSKVDAIRKINRYQSELFAHFLDRMHETDDEGQPLLDSSLVLWGGAIRDGNRHDHHDLPILLAGRGGGRVEPGRILHFPKHTPLCDLYLRMIRLAGGDAETFGDSKSVVSLS